MVEPVGRLHRENQARTDRRVLPFLADCARLQIPNELVARVRHEAEAIDDWDACVASAEQHGLGPLLHHHVRAGMLAPPERARRQLWALYGRHRRENEVRLRALEEVLTAFDDAGIPVVVLKGPALATLVYRDPALRPMGDLDLLVPAAELIRAQRTLGELRFHAPLPPSSYRLDRKHHLTAAVRFTEGVTVAVELHRDALGADRGRHLPWEARGASPLRFSIGGRRAESLEPGEMLSHLCRHMTGLWHPLRLVWIADVLSFCDAFEAHIDWSYSGRDMPFVRSTLALIDVLTPVIGRVRERALLGERQTPRGVGLDYTGWPRAQFQGGSSAQNRRRYLADTCRPPEWWLRLTYGAAHAGLAVAYARHLSALSTLALRRVRDHVF